eukprot:3472362-Rhodomonas_salina.4
MPPAGGPARITVTVGLVSKLNGNAKPGIQSSLKAVQLVQRRIQSRLQLSTRRRDHDSYPGTRVESHTEAHGQWQTLRLRSRRTGNSYSFFVQKRSQYAGYDSRNS